MTKHLIWTFGLIFIFSSCEKAGKGGRSTISGTLSSQNNALSSSTVYIKYGEDIYSGISVADYDDIKTLGKGENEFNFSQLNKGRYFIFAVGFDTLCSCELVGGIGVSDLRKDDFERVTINLRE